MDRQGWTDGWMEGQMEGQMDRLYFIGQKRGSKNIT